MNDEIKTQEDVLRVRVARLQSEMGHLRAALKRAEALREEDRKLFSDILGLARAGFRQQ